MVVSGGKKVHLKRWGEGSEPTEGLGVQRPLCRDRALSRFQVRKDVEGAAQMFRDQMDTMGVAELQDGNRKIHEGFGVERALFA